eukprot:g35359.t1
MWSLLFLNGLALFAIKRPLGSIEVTGSTCFLRLEVVLIKVNFPVSAISRPSAGYLVAFWFLKSLGSLFQSILNQPEVADNRQSPADIGLIYYQQKHKVWRMVGQKRLLIKTLAYQVVSNTAAFLLAFVNTEGNVEQSFKMTMHGAWIFPLLYLGYENVWSNVVEKRFPPIEGQVEKEIT